MSQVSPWNVRFNFRGDFYFADIGGSASWNKTLNLAVDIPIDNFNDPFYIKGTNGNVVNKFVKTPFSSFVSGSDITNLTNHSLNSYYISSSSAPSFLKRMQGDFSSDANGVESLVNLQELSSEGVNVQQKSVVDYIYFNSASNPANCNVLPSGMPSWFRLDDSHLATYEVSCAP